MNFYLSEEIPFRSEALDWAHTSLQEPAFWIEVAHMLPPRPALIIRAGCHVVLHGSAERDSVLFVSLGCGLGEISRDGLTATLDLTSRSKRFRAEYPFAKFDPQKPWIEKTEHWAIPAGDFELKLSCSPGPEGDPCGDWLAVYELVVAPASKILYGRAKAHKAFRTRQELTIMSATYEHSIYEHAAPLPDDEVVAADAIDLGHILLDRRIGFPVPDFSELLARKAVQKQPLRVLSLATGAGRIEAHFLRKLRPKFVRLTIADLNARLLETAQQRLGTFVEDKLVVNLNEPQLPSSAFDVVICVSAIHHIVELETLADAIARSLARGGEFWSVGEYVGRTGARLYDESYRVANEFFQGLPEKYRRNRVSGEIESKLPNEDCSLCSYEGVRSTEIEGILASRFDEDWKDKRSCILWRLFDAAYAPNFDVRYPEPRSFIKAAVDLDYALYRAGAPPVTMNAVYLKK